MAGTVLHAKQSGLPADAGNPAEVEPTDWYANHVVKDAAGNVITIGAAVPITPGAYSGGATLIGLPDVSGINGVTTMVNIANSVRYTPLYIPVPIVIDQVIFEVTTGPAGAANLAGSLYSVDGTFQPQTPLLGTAAVAVAGAFTGMKTISITPVTVPAGTYLSTYNMDAQMTLRVWRANMKHIEPTGGASPGMVQFVNAQAYGAFPTPGTVYNQGGGLSAAGINHCMLFRWTLA